MSTSNTPPRPDQAQSGSNRRTDILERRLNPPPDRPFHEIVFSYSGPLATGNSPGYTLPFAARLYVVVGILIVPGADSSTIDVIKNGDTIGTVTMVADQRLVKAPIGGPFAPDQDIFWFETTSAGTSAADFTAIARFRPS